MTGPKRTTSSARFAGRLAALLPFAAATACAVDLVPVEDEGEVGESVADLEGPFGFQPIAPCLAESDYVPRGVVQFGLGRAPFTPACVRLATGGTVVFQGFLAWHPLEPRPLGSDPSPIEPTDAGGSVEFEFPDFGFFPFQCAAHPWEKGVVWASWAF